MNPGFLKKIRVKNRSFRDLGVVYKEAKERPKELRIGMMLVEDSEFPGHGYLSFWDKCGMIYPVCGQELEDLKAEMKRMFFIWYPHFIGNEEWLSSGDIFVKDKNGEHLISDDEITKRHQILRDIEKAKKENPNFSDFDLFF